MKKLVVIFVFALFGALASTSQATLFTGCISPGGDLKNVAEGEEPLKQCGKNDTLTQWETPEEEPEPDTVCPCDIKSTLHWTNWGVLGCSNHTQANFSVLQFRSTETPGRPLVELKIDNSSDGATTCYVESAEGLSFSADTTADEDLACEADIDELAIALGKPGGCKRP